MLQPLKPVCHRAHVLQQEKPPQREAHASQLERSPQLTPTREKAMCSIKDPPQLKRNKQKHLKINLKNKNCREKKIKNLLNKLGMRKNFLKLIKDIFKKYLELTTYFRLNNENFLKVGHKQRCLLSPCLFTELEVLASAII